MVAVAVAVVVNVGSWPSVLVIHTIHDGHLVVVVVMMVPMSVITVAIGLGILGEALNRIIIIIVAVAITAIVVEVGSIAAKSLWGW